MFKWGQCCLLAYVIWSPHPWMSAQRVALRCLTNMAVEKTKREINYKTRCFWSLCSVLVTDLCQGQQQLNASQTWRKSTPWKLSRYDAFSVWTQQVNLVNSNPCYLVVLVFQYCRRSILINEIKNKNRKENLRLWLRPLLLVPNITRPTVCTPSAG